MEFRISGGAGKATSGVHLPSALLNHLKLIPGIINVAL
jgi:hypothetical protein